MLGPQLFGLHHSFADEIKPKPSSLLELKMASCIYISPIFIFTFLLSSCEPGSKLLVLGMGDLQPLIGNPYNGYINSYYWVDEFIPYYMEI